MIYRCSVYRHSLFFDKMFFSLFYHMPSHNAFDGKGGRKKNISLKDISFLFLFFSTKKKACPRFVNSLKRRIERTLLMMTFFFELKPLFFSSFAIAHHIPFVSLILTFHFVVFVYNIVCSVYFVHHSIDASQNVISLGQ